MKKVLVVFGGCSSEYEVSLVSASAVAEAIDRKQYEVLYLGINREGHSYLFEGNPERIAKDKWQDTECFPATVSMSRKERALWVDRKGLLEKIKFDIAFPVLHGKNGEDGTFQGLCELADIPIAGCHMEGSVLGMDKNIAHKLVACEGIKVPASVCLNRMEEYHEKLREIKKLGLPVFVKPVRAGSSFGISCVNEEKELDAAVANAFCHDTEVVIEEAIDGFEVGCAVMGNDNLIIGRVDEIELTKGFFDYDEKYTLKTSAIHMPARISLEEEERIKQTAERIYKTLKCKGFTRVDMFYTSHKDIVFNEVNTIPGFTEHSRFPNMMKGINKDFQEVVNEILMLCAGNM